MYSKSRIKTATHMTDLLIRGGTIVTVDNQRRVVREGSVAISGGKIEAVGKDADIYPAHRAGKVLDARGKLILPGLINTHTHLFQTLLRGLGDDHSLMDWFRRAIAKSAPLLSEEDCYVAALLGCVEAIKSGTTCINDFMYPHPAPKLGDSVVRAYQEAGIRGIVDRGIIDTGEDEGIPPALIQETDDAIRDCERLIQNYSGASDGRIRIWPAPFTIWGTTEEGFLKAKNLAEKYDTMLAVHVAESTAEVEHSRKLYGCDEIEFQERIGFLGDNVLAVHSVWLSEKDLRIFKVRDVKVSHCPVSNMYLADGIAPVPRMLLSGITVSLGSDGPASNNNQDMISVLKFAALLHKVHSLDPTSISAEKVIEMATIDGARSLGLEKEIGSIDVGKRADIAIVNLKSHNTVALHNPISSLVYCATQENVDSVIVDGKVLMEGRKLKFIHEESLLEKAEKVGYSLAERAGTLAFRERPWKATIF